MSCGVVDTGWSRTATVVEICCRGKIGGAQGGNMRDRSPDQKAEADRTKE